MKMIWMSDDEEEGKRNLNQSLSHDKEYGGSIWDAVDTTQHQILIFRIKSFLLRQQL